MDGRMHRSKRNICCGTSKPLRVHAGCQFRMAGFKRIRATECATSPRIGRYRPPCLSIPATETPPISRVRSVHPHPSRIPPVEEISMCRRTFLLLAVPAWTRMAMAEDSGQPGIAWLDPNSGKPGGLIAAHGHHLDQKSTGELWLQREGCAAM